MNPKAQLLTVKDQKELPRTAREFEAFLRDAGWSRSEAKRLVSQGFTKGSEIVDEDVERDAPDAATIEQLKQVSESLRSIRNARIARNSRND
jgi:hypothetical protein